MNTMFFKLTIWLLYFIIAANTVLRHSENEASTSYTEPDNIFEDKHVIKTEAMQLILKDSYDDCRRWLGKSLFSTITITDFLLYMGKNQSDKKTVTKYCQDNKEALAKQNVIDLNLYGKLFQHICSKRGVSIKNWTTHMKIKAATRTLEDIKLLDWGDHD
ncbi:uncharacterized protein LOC126847075 [Adelges cooleyi]|uniref:uncharacterized protein LOC126847075 n=1 Tax=Adelges cooleyi TaxID=133065 RepID=UPI0021800E18|nr:uncharacterized protein LOC126847075 [Adelges cooleyi]